MLFVQDDRKAEDRIVRTFKPQTPTFNYSVHTAHLTALSKQATIPREIGSLALLGATVHPFMDVATEKTPVFPDL